MTLPSRSFAMLRCDQVTADPSVQPRECLDGDVVLDYAEALRAVPPAEFPPVVVFQEGKTYWLASGFHRHAAHVKAGRSHILADVRQGTRRDAILFAVGANKKHGLRLCNQDKRRAVGLLLADPEWVTWSNPQIAAQCGVSEYLVREVRAEMFPTSSGSKIRTAARGASTYAMNTANIGQPPAPKSLDGREKAALCRLAQRLIDDWVGECRRKHPDLQPFLPPEDFAAAEAHLGSYLEAVQRAAPPAEE